jgi:hypothetical protein
MGAPRRKSSRGGWPASGLTRNRLGGSRRQDGVADGEAFLVPGGEHSRQAQQIAAGYVTRERFLTELTLTPLAKRVVQRPGFKATMPLAKHDLMSFGMLQVGKSFFRSFKSSLKAQNVMPEREASLKVIHMKTTSQGPSTNFARCSIIHLDL